MHPGKKPELAKAQGEANMLAWSAEAGRDMPPLDTGQVVMDQLRVAVMRADFYGELLRLQVEGEGGGGLVGATYAVGREGHRVETGEQVRGLARLEAEWRDRAVRFAKTAHDMGIAERVIELAQGQAELVTAALLAVCDALGLVPGDRDLAVRTFMSRLGRGELLELEPGGSATGQADAGRSMLHGGTEDEG